VELRASRFDYRGRPAVLGLISDITQRSRPSSQLREVSELVQAVEDSVLDHMAVLDRQGLVVAVNAAWTAFAQAQRAGRRRRPGTGVGSNYLTVCDDAAAAGDAAAADAAARHPCRAVGRRSLFRLEYACHAPTRSAGSR
jgi:two-component system sensor histidine kinase/response regulator